MGRKKKTETQNTEVEGKKRRGRPRKVAVPEVKPAESKAAEPKAKAKTPKHVAVPEGGEITINEQVGVHFRTSPENAPKEGGIITIQFNDGTSDVKLFLNVKSVISTKDGNRLIQAFCEKNSGDYKFMVKGAKAIWHHAISRPTKPTTTKGKGAK